MEDLELRALPGISVRERAPLSEYTRFGVGGEADLVIDAHNEHALIAVLTELKRSAIPLEVISEGSNLIVSDEGFEGAIVRYRASSMRIDGTTVAVEAGVVLQDLVDQTIAHGLSGVHTMTGIPGSVGAAVYGNAGAYGRSISESVREVRYYDGARIATCTNAECEFEYRESIFKRHKNWVILSTQLSLETGDASELAAGARKIRAIRDEKYPPTMRCAGSIFKNLLLNNLSNGVRTRVPQSVIREGKVPAAWFLEQSGVKGMRIGGIHVADYHANLIFNAGSGTAQEVRRVIDNCKSRVRVLFGLELEEEVQFIGFSRPT